MVPRKQLLMLLFSFNLVVASIYANMMDERVQLPSPGSSLVNQATFLGPAQPNSTIQFTVWLKLRNRDKLDQLVKDQYDRKSPSYQKFLTYEEFEQHYAPSQEAEIVQQYFDAQGMQANIVNHTVRVTAEVQQVEQVFQVQINNYLYQNSEVYASATEPTLSADIAQYISEISGLNNMIRFRPTLSTRRRNAPNFVRGSFIPNAQPTITSVFAGFTGAQLRTAYSLDNLNMNGTVIDGAGQTLVILDACDVNDTTTITSDANQYNTANGLAPLVIGTNFAVVNPDGSTYTTCATSGETGWKTEIALDVESSHTVAPGANIVLVLAGSDADFFTAAVDLIYLLLQNNFTIAGFPNAYVISNSFSVPDLAGPFPGPEALLELAAAHGISINFSSGDGGDNISTYGQLSVNYPASSAYTTAVGGTSLFVDNNWNYAFESGWGTYTTGFVFGSSGGISLYNGPVSWQNSISDFTAGGYTSGTVGSYGKRALPDIAMLGDPETGLQIYCTGESSPFVDGGTSLACPLFSATLVLINQARVLLNKGAPIGQAAPYLYQENNTLLNAKALNLVIPPHQIITGATSPPMGAPLSAFTINGITFSWDSTLTIEPENQFWNDVVGVGSPYIPNFVMIMSNL